MAGEKLVKFLRLKALYRTFEMYCCEMESYVPCNASWVPYHGGMGVPVGEACKERVQRNRIHF